MQLKRIILAVAADKHGGFTLGLQNPETVIEIENQKDGSLVDWKPPITPWQEYIWERQEEYIKSTKELAGKDEIIVFDMGDLTHGNHYMSEIVSTNISHQFEIAAWNLRPWLNLPNVKTVRISKGTAVHSFGEGASEIIIANKLRGWYPKIDIKSVYHGLAQIGGILVDYAHHGPPGGSRNWLRGNEARYYLRSLIKDEMDVGNIPPHLVLRAHFHTFVEEFLATRANGNRYTSWIIVLPSLCGMSDYSRNRARSTSKITMGMVVFEIVEGKILDIHPMFETLDIRTKERLA